MTIITLVLEIDKEASDRFEFNYKNVSEQEFLDFIVTTNDYNFYINNSRMYSVIDGRLMPQVHCDVPHQFVLDLIKAGKIKND